MKVTTGGTLRLSDGTSLRVDEIEQVGPRVEWVGCWVPDPDWSRRDQHGHVHRWFVPAGNQQADPVIPTATRSEQHVECDGTCGNLDCGGYTITVWHCDRCGDQIEPGYRPSRKAVEVESGFIRFDTYGEADGDLPLLAGGEATLEWPVGPGQMASLAGRVWETSDRDVWFDGELAWDRRRFEFHETTTALVDT